jgi:GT2 family glycosyltransferase
MTQFTVLICTYNRHDLLDQALNALVNLTTEKPDEIVIVNGGDERADPVITKYSGRFGIDLKLIKTINKNLASSRNIGLLHCTGDIVAMTDDDAEVFPDWVTQMKRVHAGHPEAGAVGGAVIGADSQHSFLSRLSDVATFPSAQQPGYVRTIAGVNISYKKEMLEIIGPQDETLFRGEDVDFNWRIHRLGFQVYYDPSIRVIHHHRPILRKFLRQNYMYGRAYYLVRRKWPEMYCVYPHRIHSVKEVLKLVNFFSAVIYQPVQFAWRFQKWQDRLLALPVLFANQLVWKTGMIRQMLISQ